MKFSCRPGCWVLAALHEPQRRLCSLIRRHCFTSGFISVSVYFILENSSPEFCRSLQNQSVIRRVDIHLFLIIFAGVFLGSDFLWESQVTDRENTQQLRHENTRLWKKEMRINQKKKKNTPHFSLHVTNSSSSSVSSSEQQRAASSEDGEQTDIFSCRRGNLHWFKTLGFSSKGAVHQRMKTLLASCWLNISGSSQ